MNRITKRIIIGVSSLHILVLICFAFAKKSTPPQLLNPIVVNTYRYEPPPQKIAKPKPKPIAKAPVKKKAPPKPKRKTRDVLTELEKGLSKITPPPKQKTEVKKVAYAMLLVGRLQSSLHLPEEGNVQLKLTLASSGKVIGLSILQSHSMLNSQYLEEEIPKLYLPSFSGDHLGKKQATFTLTVCHDS